MTLFAILIFPSPYDVIMAKLRRHTKLGRGRILNLMKMQSPPSVKLKNTKNSHGKFFLILISVPPQCVRMLDELENR